MSLKCTQESLVLENFHISTRLHLNSEGALEKNTYRVIGANKIYVIDLKKNFQHKTYFIETNYTKLK